MPGSKTELLARIAWLYYVNEKTQEEIGRLYNMSRPSVQRCLNEAQNQGIVVTRLDHSLIEGCMEIALKLIERFDLNLCEVAPTFPKSATKEIFDSVCETGALVMERFVRDPDPVSFALGSGTTLKECIKRMNHFDRVDHSVTTLAGLTTPNGTPSEFDLVTPFSEKTGAMRFFLPAPLVLPSKEEKQKLMELSIYQVVETIALKAEVSFVSVAPLNLDSPFLKEGFVESFELTNLIKTGACGEILGRVFDKNGVLINSDFNERIAGVSLTPPNKRFIIGVSGGPSKHMPLLAALRGEWINGLITDEDSAKFLLEH